MKLSIILPTYNNEKTLDSCLKSIFENDFSREDMEILLIDGGSDDKTREIAKKYPVIILDNVKRSEEPARILGINQARGEITAFIDADNVLIDKHWIRKMLKPFEDKDIAFADTIYFSYRNEDSMKVRYQALIGGDDPLATYLGLYSRWCYFKNNWTDFPYKKEVKEGYLKVELSNKELVPAMGSNGFLVRTDLLRRFVKNSFIHSDFVYELVNGGHNCFAKVYTGIVHDQPTFFKNKIRRIERRLNDQVNIKYNYGMNPFKVSLIFLRSVLFIPVLTDIIIGYMRKKDKAWIFHIPALYGLILIHAYFKIFGKLLKGKI